MTELPKYGKCHLIAEYVIGTLKWVMKIMTFVIGVLEYTIRVLEYIIRVLVYIYRVFGYIMRKLAEQMYKLWLEVFVINEKSKLLKINQGNWHSILELSLENKDTNPSN